MKKKVLIVVANYYPEISDKLKSQALKILKKKVYFEVTFVPGIFEIPVVISRNIKSYDAFVALGCVIKGKTFHFELITTSVTDALMNLSITYQKPIGNGIISCFIKKQALKRLSKGAEASTAILKVLNEKKFKR